MASKKHKELKANVIALLKAMDNSCTKLWKPSLDESISCYVEFPEAITYEPEGGKNCHDDDHIVQGFSTELETLNTQLRGELVEVFFDGDWDVDFNSNEDCKAVVIWDKGVVHQVRLKELVEFMEERGFYKYFIPTMFEHKDWNGEIIYRTSHFQQELRALEFTTDDEFFDYIINSNTNGQPQQVRNLYATLKEHGKDREFRDYVKDSYGERTLLEILETVV